jgi:hypothetical protein
MEATNREYDPALRNRIGLSGGYAAQDVTGPSRGHGAIAGITLLR